MRNKLARCPCGQTPTELGISDVGQGSKWAQVFGTCCGEWSLEFKTQYHEYDSEECMVLAIDAWNGAPRSAALS